MYNRVYAHVTSNGLLYEKQFGFQSQNCTERAILQLTKEIYESFEKNEYTLGVFVDLSKAFDTVNHNILLMKLEYFGLKNKYINWFKSYLSNRQQFVSYDNNKQSRNKNINCGVPQGSILGPLLFLLYVNASNILKHIKIVIQYWLDANKLSLNATKTKYSFFHCLFSVGKIPVRLPELKISNTAIREKKTRNFWVFF